MGVIHRGDLQRILLKAAQKHGCHILTSHNFVAAHKDFLPQVQVIDRKTGLTKSMEGDLIIAADGIRSTLRKQMAKAGNYMDQLVPTGDAAFRLLVHRESVKHDQELLSMLDSNIAVRYMGPGGHVMAYPLKRNLL